MATIVAAMIAKARRDIQHYFFKADAVRPERAVRFEPHNRMQERQFEFLRARGVIHEARPGYFWIDIPKYDSELHRRLTIAHTLLIAVLLAAVVLGIGISFAGR